VPKGVDVAYPLRLDDAFVSDAWGLKLNGRSLCDSRDRNYLDLDCARSPV
jgi:hypothetical protein